MKKRKLQAHNNIGVARDFVQFERKLQKSPMFTHLAIMHRDIFGPRLRQKRRMYLYLERRDRV